MSSHTAALDGTPKAMTFGTFCSGIGAPERAWTGLGWQAKFVSEIEPFPCAVLAHHHPDVPNLGNMELIADETLARFNPDVVCAGTPCQSFSVAGLRKGMADPRGNLALVFLRLVDRLRPRWLVWENVPGVLSSADGRDFGSFLGALGQLGYGWSYRVLDAQYFGVPQRRRRVFVVGCLGDWRSAAAVLFERHCLSGHPAPSRETGQAVAGTIKACANGSGTPNGAEEADRLIVEDGGGISRCLNAGGMGRQDFETETLIPITGGFFSSPSVIPIHQPDASDRDSVRDGCGVGVAGDPMFTLRDRPRDAIAFAQNQRDEVRTMDVAGALAGEPGMKQQTYVAFKESQSGCRTGDVHATLDANKGSNRMEGVMNGMAVRRLTPRECERLQGFPDNYTAIPFKSKPAADGPRYRALGNSMAVPVLRWIGERIATVDAVMRERGAA